MSELEDFEAFLGGGFDPIQFASSLLQATNVVDDTELDLSTPLKKLQFDAHECDKRMEALTSMHHNDLLRNLDTVEAQKKLMNNVITPLAARLNTAYDRIKKDVISPYDEAVKLNNALQKLHQTATLLRGTSLFVVLLQQLYEGEKLVKLSENNKDVIRLAKTHVQIASFFSKSKVPAKDSNIDILSLKLIRDYKPLFQVKTSEFMADLELKISNDLGHHSSFNANNMSLQNNMLALRIIDTPRLFSVIDRSAMSKSIQIALAQLTRSLQSPRTLASAFSEIEKNATTFSDTLYSILSSYTTVIASESANNPTLIDAFLLSLLETECSSIEEVYWSRLAFKFKKNVAATMARGGPIARNLRSQYLLLLESVDMGLEGVAAISMKDALNLIGEQTKIT